MEDVLPSDTMVVTGLSDSVIKSYRTLEYERKICKIG